MVNGGCQTEPLAPVEQEQPIELPVLSGAILGGSAPLRRAVARFFAPVIYQKTEDVADYLTKVTYDGDWQALNNWENLNFYPLAARVYASVIEDQHRWFVYYGLFHPRDWCSWPVVPWCLLGADQHENDLEGVSLVVDKRLATTNWPYGQIVTAETVFHNQYKRYRNCFGSGDVVYVRPSQLWNPSSGWDGCVFRVLGYNSTTPSPVEGRVMVAIEPRGHGVELCGPPVCTAYPTGVVYIPTNIVSEVPPSPSLPWVEVAYSIQFVDAAEAPLANSLWARRLATFSDPPTPFGPEGPIGPHQSWYRWRFGGNNGTNYQANAPWGFKQDEITTVMRGDWHNHPAWTWSQHYDRLPGSQYESYYDYCQAPACRFNQSYVYNPFWDNAGFHPIPPQCTDPLCIFPGPPGDDLQSPAIPPARRWEFVETLGGMEVKGDGVGAVLLRVDDGAWGYPAGLADVARVSGRGQVEIALPVNIESALFGEFVIRLRHAESDSARLDPDLAWQAWDAVPVRPEARLARPRATGGGWDLYKIDLRNEAAWIGMERVTKLVLTLDLGPVGSYVDLDFVTVTP